MTTTTIQWIDSEIESQGLRDYILKLSEEEVRKLNMYAESIGVSPYRVLTDYIRRLPCPPSQNQLREAKLSKKTLCYEAKLLILRLHEDWRHDQKMPAMLADYEFSELYKQRQLPLPEWVYNVQPTLSRSTILGWWRRNEKSDLMDKYKGRPGKRC